MKIVQPNEVTTLLLDPAYMPFGVATARGAFYAILGGKGSGIDADGTPYKWDQYVSRNISVLPDQPVMRSGFNPAYSSNVWVIPTVVVVNSKFFFKRRRETNSLPSLKEVYDFYKGVCCFCHSKVKFSESSREHVHSRALGGSNHSDNIALSCKRCNSLAGHAMPKLDIHGNEVQAKMRIRPAHYLLPSSIEPRKEWAPFLFAV
jgi:5-methylcytosine-specific restriction endonuclease McrA